MSVYQSGRILTKPKALFLADGFGAMLSALLLGVVLVKFRNLFGIPEPTLYLLASFPCAFAIYDFFCYSMANEHIGTLLKGIAIANIAYCILSLGLTLFHYETVTVLGWIYILLEICIVMALATFELRVARKTKKYTSL